jgi:hypothetical protein
VFLRGTIRIIHIIQVLIFVFEGSAVAQAVSHRPLPRRPRVRSEVSPCAISGELGQFSAKNSVFAF